jgi:putative methyltransferase (TIGR04325 family)
MKQKIIKLVKEIVPPIALNIYRNVLHQAFFSGNYKTWQEAQRASTGYDSDLILNKVKQALLQVKNGQAVYERDSVLFDKMHYSWPLLAGLLWVASREGNRLNLVDFGGSLGSTYYQNIKFLTHLNELAWSIIEQKKFVEYGKRHFENDHLKFYHDLDECMSARHPDAILFSSVIQYLENPYDLLTNVLKKGFTYIIFDRTSFLEKGDDRITVQKVPPEIYPASYPAWFFNQDRFLNFFSKDYVLITDFESFESFRIGSISAQNKGFIFQKKNTEA